MIKYTLDTTDLKKGLKAYAKYLNVGTNDALYAVGLAIRGDAIANLDRNNSRDRGRLRTNITVNRLASGRVRVGTETGYGAYIEFGRPPGKAPKPEKLIGWVRRKLGLRGKQAKQTAYLISRKIARFGTKPKPYLRPAFDASKRNLIKHLRQNV